jgi:hypothetical protein
MDAIIRFFKTYPISLSFYLLYGFIWCVLTNFTPKKEYTEALIQGYYLLIAGGLIFTIVMLLCALLNKEHRKFYLLMSLFTAVPVVLFIVTLAINLKSVQVM